jgi:hypothetical protein
MKEFPNSDGKTHIHSWPDEEWSILRCGTSLAQPASHLRTVAAKPTYNVAQSRSGAAARQMRNGSGATRFGI